MDFGLSEEQELLQATVRQFVATECPPKVLRALFESDDDEASLPLWRGLAGLGLAGLAVPEAHGGAGLGLLDLALAAEVLGHGACPGPFLGHSLATLALALGGSAAQQRAWLPRLAAGEILGSVALAEAEGGWQPEEWTAKADGRLTGRKSFVPAAGAADLLVVGVAGGGLALVEKEAPGVRVEPQPISDRTRRVGRVTFEGSRCELLPGGPAAGARLRDAALVLLAADALGGAARCVETSVAYARTREQFGVTIGHFQALKHQLADMALEVEPSRALCWFAAHAFDRLPEEAPRAAALAKAHLTDAYMQVARDTVEAHGGIGFTWECDVQIWFKRALFDRAFAGTPELQRERAARLAGW